MKPESFNPSWTDGNTYPWGDKGKTGIHGGRQVDEDDGRVEADGTLDELNSLLGLYGL